MKRFALLMAAASIRCTIAISPVLATTLLCLAIYGRISWLVAITLLAATVWATIAIVGLFAALAALVEKNTE